MKRNWVILILLLANCALLFQSGCEEQATAPRQLSPAQGPFNQQRTVYPHNDRAYKALHEYADLKGTDIYNCNPDSRVEEFEKITFEQAFRIIEKDGKH